MTPLPEPALEGKAACPSCGAEAEPEQDGDAVYFACPRCEAEFGYRKAQGGAFCAAGLPVLVAEPEPVLIATTITMRRPE